MGRMRATPLIEIGRAGQRLAVRIARKARAFERDERGAVAVVFGLMFTVIVFLAALAIDHSRFTSEHMQDRNALDAALLAAAHTIGSPDQDELSKDRVRSYYLANRQDGRPADISDVSIDEATGTIVGRTRFDWKTTLLGAFGYEKVALGSSASVKRNSSAEVVLVLDNSSWMAGSPISDLKTSAKLLTDILFSGGSTSASLKVGVVPFAGAVNVGSTYRTATWIDTAGLSPVHRENYRDYQSSGATSATRFDLFQTLGVSWAGCVEARPGGYELSDAIADSENPASFFVPMFAPDEPDPENNPDAATGAVPDYYYNSYIPDNPVPACPAQQEECLRYSRRNNCESMRVIPLPVEQAQKQICKYDSSQIVSNEIVSFRQGANLRTGPNFGCTSEPLLPLSSDKIAIEAKIDSMLAEGGANISEGIMWGYRVLSPAEPFTEGESFDDPGTKKFMVLLARGANFVEAFRDALPNHSIYTPWGYGSTDRLNPQSHTESALTNAMNSKSREACRLATDSGVQVFTIGYGVSDAHTRSMLKYCASHPSMHFDIESQDELLQVFDRIGQTISELRVTG